MFESFGSFANGKDLFLIIFFIISGEEFTCNSMDIWSEYGDIRRKYLFGGVACFSDRRESDFRGTG